MLGPQATPWERSRCLDTHLDKSKVIAHEYLVSFDQNIDQQYKLYRRLTPKIILGYCVISKFKDIPTCRLFLLFQH